jgi:hypothetical protein
VAVNYDPADIIQIYDDYVEKCGKENVEERYVGNESWYHASAAGMCVRRIYYESVEQAERTNPPNATSLRLMRLGTIVHDDLQDSLHYVNNIYNNNIDVNNIKEKSKYTKKKRFRFEVEQEIRIEELNVRGFLDVVAYSDDEVYLYDFKTAGAFPWKKMFGRDGDSTPPNHQQLQIGTYAYAVKEEYGRLDGINLMYYSKNTSVMKGVKVPLAVMNKAFAYWRNVKQKVEMGVPDYKLGSSPSEDWVCNYCPYLNHCDPPFKKGKR